jgi:hypothetical protein
MELLNPLTEVFFALYSRCIFCNRPLGTNQDIEFFPHGRRLAFDSLRGRLWVVCGSCSRWNLSPIEERWEAVEECERIFEETKERFSTENIGLARHRSGTELVRVGKPKGTEFAFWRYGTGLRRRWGRNAVWYGIGVTAASVAFLGTMVGGATAFVGLSGIVNGGAVIRSLRPVARFRRDPSENVLIRLSDLGTLQSVVDAEGSFDLRVKTWGAEVRLQGEEVNQFLLRALPLINRFGSKHDLQKACSEVSSRGDPKAFADFVLADERWRRIAVKRPAPVEEGLGGFITRMPRPLRLGLEMALNESREEEALAGELAALEAAWREAEEIAAISDNLLLPKNWARFRARHRGG